MGRNRLRRGAYETYLDAAARRGPLNSSDSTGAIVSQAELEELRALQDNLRKLVQEAHGVLKDLRIETRQARRVLPMIVAKRIKTEITNQLAVLGESIQEAMAVSVDKVGKEFDKLAAVYLGTDSEARRQGKLSIPELAELAATLTDTADLLPGSSSERNRITQEVHGKVQQRALPRSNRD